MHSSLVALSDERVIILVRKCWRANQPPNTTESGWIFPSKKKHVLLGHPSVHSTRMVQLKNSWHNKSRCGQYFAFDIMTTGNIFGIIQIRSCTSYDLLGDAFVHCLFPKSGSV